MGAVHLLDRFSNLPIPLIKSMTLSNKFSVFPNKVLQVEMSHTLRVSARMLIEGGGVYSYIQVLPD